MGKTKCLDCGKYDKFSKGLCLGCWKINHAKPIRKISEKHQKTISEYGLIRKEFLKENPSCQIKLNGCTRIATEIHHSKGKSSKEQYLKKEDFVATCRSCHNYVEAHPKFAKENGFSKNRL